MRDAELVLALLIAVAALVTIARRLQVAYPIFLVIGGLALGFVPGVPHPQLEPEVIFLLVLPPLLYVAGFFTELRSFRANLGKISSLAVGLVVATALAVAVVAHSLIADLPWPIAIALGAIVAPPDAVAATAVASRLLLPRRIVTILEGESLLNDATALTLYGAAIAAAVASTFSPIAAMTTFLYALAGGAAIGLAVAWLIAEIRSRMEDTPVEVTISLLTPYAAFLPAQQLGVSGVIATVVAGLYLGGRGSRIAGADTRLAGRAVWEMVIFLLNGLVFILTGLEVSLFIRALAPGEAFGLIGIGLAVSAVAIVVRGAWIFASAYLPLLARRHRATPRRLGQVLVLSWAGMRGVVSLALALALPVTLANGAPFPAREALVVVTFTVIIVTLVGQGLTLPWLIGRLGLAGEADEAEAGEEADARARLVAAANRRIDELFPVWPGHKPLLDQLRETYRHRSEHVERQRDAADGDADRELIEHGEIRRTVIDAQREALLRLRAEGAIDDGVRRKLERELDLEEQRMDA